MVGLLAFSFLEIFMAENASFVGDEDLAEFRLQGM